MVGLAIARQLSKRGIEKNIILVDKEASLGLHSSEEIVVYFMQASIINLIVSRQEYV